jgi:hypothetical protein
MGYEATQLGRMGQEVCREGILQCDHHEQLLQVQGQQLHLLHGSYQSRRDQVEWDPKPQGVLRIVPKGKASQVKKNCSRGK